MLGHDNPLEAYKSGTAISVKTCDDYSVSHASHAGAESLKLPQAKLFLDLNRAVIFLSKMLRRAAGKSKTDMKMKKKLWIVILVALLAMLIVWRWRAGKKENGDQDRGGPQAVAVETGPVRSLDLAETATFSGNLKAANSFILAPKVAGQLLRLHARLGDRVRKGQLIAELEDVLYRQEYEKAAANLEQAASALSDAAKNLEHNRQLLAGAFISQDEFDRVNAQYNSELAKHRVALAGRNSAQFQLEHTKVTADWSGGPDFRVIGAVLADEGQLLSAGAPLVSVLDISSLVAEVDVIESDYHRIKLGQPASVSLDAWPGERFTGRVARIAPQLSEQSRQARVEIEVANPALKLAPGMYARVEITYRNKAQVTAIPAAAICRHKGQTGVFTVDNAASQVNFVPVETGIATREHVEILDPPLSGEVVTLGQDQLDDGRKVILPGAKPASGKAGSKK